MGKKKGGMVAPFSTATGNTFFGVTKVVHEIKPPFVAFYNKRQLLVSSCVSGKRKGNCCLSDVTEVLVPAGLSRCTLNALMQYQFVMD